MASDARKLLAVADRTRSVAEVGAGQYEASPALSGAVVPRLKTRGGPFRAALREKGTAMIDWRHVPSSAFDAEQAVVGDFKLVVFDAPSNYLGPSEIIWELFGPPGWQRFLATGKANSFNAAKVAAEQALAELSKPA